jgi:endonuclease/exonuclease/phosphatase (EEP) superfamily protein YafD
VRPLGRRRRGWELRARLAGVEDLGSWTGRRLAAAIVAASVASFVAAFFASFVPAHPFSIIEHFRLHLLLGGAAVTAAAGALALGAGWLDARWLDAALIALLLDACVLVPDLGSARREAGAGAPVRVLVVNVLRSSEHFAAVRRLIADERPDMIGLAEYPGRIEAPRSDNFGMALYARGALAGAAERLELRVPAILAQAEVGGVRLAVALVHPPPPLAQERRVEQLRHFDAVAARVRQLGAPFLVMGDFNAAPWSRAFVRLRGALGACDTRAGFGAQTSYPADGWLLRIPIDHVLASCAIGVHDRRVGPAVGSDHLPVIADLVVPPP